MKQFMTLFWSSHELDKKVQAHLNDLEKNLTHLNRSPLTLKSYKHDLKFYLTWWYARKASHCCYAKAQDISSYLELLEKGGRIEWIPRWWQKLLFIKQESKVYFSFKPHKVASRRRHLSSIKKFYELMKEINAHTSFKNLKENPVRPLLHAMSLKDRDQQPTQALSHDEFRQVWERPMKLETRLALCLMFYGGLRLQEVVDLKVDEFDFNQQSIEFIRKGGRRHRLRPENAQLIFKYALLHLKNRSIASHWVFAGQKTDSALTSRALALRIRKLFDQANLKKSQGPHGLRKSRATLLYQKTRDLLFVRDYLNHKDAKVTQHYIDTSMIWELEQSPTISHNGSSLMESSHVS